MTPRIIAEAGAIEWYHHEQAGLGRKFATEFELVLVRIGDAPARYHRDPFYRGSAILRRAPFNRFPYHVVFELRTNEILVVAVAHDHRQPAYWADRVDS